MSSYSSGGYSGVLIQSRGLSLMGYILESDNSSVSTFGRRLQIEGFSTKKTVNLVSLLKQLIEVQSLSLHCVKEKYSVAYHSSRLLGNSFCDSFYNWNTYILNTFYRLMGNYRMDWGLDTFEQELGRMIINLK